ncbi:hypothetical protein PoB_004690800 [Plakobranchus ocellatus]|uniref:Uncharacterized protein n=1 Tax=Plakobranchus ocellatus TaxID=259542 RepID=A0AAV4BMP0_9GAST|nr:hypothetical protein PoB_004690800 [Plakobranchus ocellatus]
MGSGGSSGRAVGYQRSEVRISVRANPQEGDLRVSGPPSGQGAGGGARTSDRRIPANLRADWLATVPPTPHHLAD